MAQSPQYTLAKIGPPFHGRVSNANQHALPSGAAQAQNNVGIFSGGLLQGRGGMNISAFANAITANASNVIAMTSYNRPEGRYVIYLQADGTLKAGRNPS